jgi:hypothetical protein
MKLNQRRSAHVIADNKYIAVEYSFTKDDVGGQQPGPRKLWAVIKFTNPQTRSVERLRVEEPQSLLEASDKEILAYIEREIECFFRHCDEETEAVFKRR